MNNQCYLLSPQEPQTLKDAFAGTAIVSGKIEEKGADIFFYVQWHHVTKSIGIQRKVIPSDFLASLQDGRLGRELANLSEKVDFPILLLEGTIPHVYRQDDPLWPNLSRISAIAYQNIIRSVHYQMGCRVEFSKSELDTVRVVSELRDYLSRQRHDSLLRRPSAPVEWIVASHTEESLWLLQGLPGVGPELARRLLEHFKFPLAVFLADRKELYKVAGIGKKIADRIYECLLGGKN